MFLCGARCSVGDCRQIRRPAKDAPRKHEPSSAGLETKAFGHQKMALESTLPPHNDGVARRVSERIESCFDAQSELLWAGLRACPSRVQDESGPHGSRARRKTSAV